MRLLRECIASLVREAWYEETYETATAENLMLDEPGHVVEPDVRAKVFAYLKQMGLVQGRNPRPKASKRKAYKV